MTVRSGGYLFDPAWEGERQRLQLGEYVWDPVTERQLDAIGLAAGWACLEVGAGAGSIARLLASRVGPEGRVVAVDTDLRFLGEVEGGQLEVRRLDVVRDELPDAAYDLAHARLVLMHLPQRRAVLHRLARALRPGGWLLVEEFDWLTGGVHPPSRPISQLIGAHCRLMRLAGADPWFGRKVAAALRRAGLEEVVAEGNVRLSPGGPLATMAYRLAIEQQRPRMVELGLLTEAQIEAALASMNDEALQFRTPMMVSARGRRPEGKPNR